MRPYGPAKRRRKRERRCKEMRFLGLTLEEIAAVHRKGHPCDEAGIL